MSSYLGNVSCLEYSDNSIFFAKPASIKINEDSCTRYASSQKIEILIKELKETGPLVGLGKIGPSSYADEPFKLKDKIHGQDIYGWKPGTKRHEYSKQNYVLILGAKKLQESEYVYFTVSEDVTQNTNSFLRKHRPSNTDTKVYVISHKTFRNYLTNLYPSISMQEIVGAKSVFFISSKPSVTPSLSASEQEYVKKLSSISPLDSILDMGPVESACKAIGQEIFDKYNQEAGGNSLAGIEAVQKICDAILFSASDGNLRKQYIERAWDGIGDKNWQWRA